MTKLAWIDLEMTGLKASSDAIMAVGVVLTDARFNPLDEREWIVRVAPEQMEGMLPVVRAMHTQNGLIEACTSPSALPLGRVQQALLTFLSTWGGRRELYMAGNSIHRDRAFIAEQLPEVDDFLHHRQLDVTALRLFRELIHPSSKPFHRDGPKDHMPLRDIYDSIDELAFYKRDFSKLMNKLQWRSK